jgi:hypothetical protein
VGLQVTDTPNNMVELRALVSARDSGSAFDLRCEVREKLIQFLQQDYPEALPRQRTEITGWQDPQRAPAADVLRRSEPERTSAAA